MVGGTSNGSPQDSKVDEAVECNVEIERAVPMLRENQNLLGRQSGAQDVQGEVSLDNPIVVIDRMTAYKRMPGRGAEVPSLRDSYTSVLATRHCRAGLQIVAFLRNSIRADMEARVRYSYLRLGMDSFRAYFRSVLAQRSQFRVAPPLTDSSIIPILDSQSASNSRRNRHSSVAQWQSIRLLTGGL